MSLKLKTPEQKKAELLAKIPTFKLMDDTYMNAFFNDQPDLVEFILRIILQKEDLRVISLRTQRPLKSLQGRSLILDVDAIDSQNTLYDVEVQQESSGADPERARVYASMIDSNVLMPGDEFKKMPESYVIFITREDYYKAGLPFYTINRHIEQLNMQPFLDKQHIIYVNGRYDDDSAIGRLMHDFRCEKPSDMYYEELAKRAHYLKETEGGRANMCKIVEELVNDEKVQTALRMLVKDKYSFEEIAEISDLTVEQVKKIAEEFKSVSA